MRRDGDGPRAFRRRSLRRRASVLCRLREPCASAGALHAGAIRAGGFLDAADHRVESRLQMKELETGVMFWAGGEPERTFAALTGLGLRCGQLALPGDLDLNCVSEWRRALDATGFTVFTVVAAYQGEDYADIP